MEQPPLPQELEALLQNVLSAVASWAVSQKPSNQVYIKIDSMIDLALSRGMMALRISNVPEADTPKPLTEKPEDLVAQALADAIKAAKAKAGPKPEGKCDGEDSGS
jgi:hypothetical protein